MVIERDVLIDAPAEVVWSVVTEPEQVRQWFADEVELDAKPGAEGELVFKDRATGNATTVRLRVEQVRPLELFSFRWVYPDGAEPRPGNSILVEFSLQPEGDKTRLRVVESGLDQIDWPEQAKTDYIEDHTAGWQKHLGQVQDHVAKLQSARP